MFGNEKAHDAKFIMTYYVLRTKHSRHMMTRAMCEIVMLFQDHINLFIFVIMSCAPTSKPLTY